MLKIPAFRMILIILVVHGNVIVNQEKVSFLRIGEIHCNISFLRMYFSQYLIRTYSFRYEIIEVIMKRPILNIESGQRMIIRDPKNNPHR